MWPYCLMAVTVEEKIYKENAVDLKKNTPPKKNLAIKITVLHQ